MKILNQNKVILIFLLICYSCSHNLSVKYTRAFPELGELDEYSKIYLNKLFTHKINIRDEIDSLIKSAGGYKYNEKLSYEELIEYKFNIHNVEKIQDVINNIEIADSIIINYDYKVYSRAIVYKVEIKAMKNNKENNLYIEFYRHTGNCYLMYIGLAKKVLRKYHDTDDE